MVQGDRDLGLAVEGRPPRQALVRDDAEAVDVRRGGEPLAGRLLGADVLGGAEHDAALGHGRGLKSPRDAEVGHFDGPDLGDEQVARLDVAVDDPRPVRGVQSLGHLADDVERDLRAERAVAAQDSGQRLARHQLHDEVGDPVALAVVEDLGDPRVGEAGGDARLVPEPFAEGGVGRHVLPQQFHRDLAAEELVRGLPHLAHAARRDAGRQPVTAAENGVARCH